MTVLQEETAMHTDQGAYCMAHNGWVMGYDPMKNFADPGRSGAKKLEPENRKQLCKKCSLVYLYPPIITTSGCFATV